MNNLQQLWMTKKSILNWNKVLERWRVKQVIKNENWWNYLTKWKILISVSKNIGKIFFLSTSSVSGLQILVLTLNKIWNRYGK